MKRPRDMVTSPKRGWTYTQPETGEVFTATHPKALERAVFKRRVDLIHFGMDVSKGWAQRMWHEVCMQNPRLDCIEGEDVPVTPSLGDVFRWVKSMAHWAAGGLKIVHQDEAERRASICVSCPYNKHIAGCLGCRGAGAMITALTGHAQTSLDSRLYACERCSGCALTAKVHLPIEAIDSTGLDLPQHCWIVESPSSTPSAPQPSRPQP